jgi:fructose/tagatose bisphosphate aldolase
MKSWNSIDDMKKGCEKSISIKGDLVTINNAELFRKETIDALIHNAVFAEDDAVKNAARWVVWEASQSLGCPSGSIHDLYIARAKDEWKNMTVPAINLRGLTYDMARTIFRALKKHETDACIFEIAKSEMGYTDQRPAEFVSCVLGAAIREGWKSPVFIQGDHFQVNAKKFASDKTSEINTLKKLITEAVGAGFYNIDIDTSTLVDLSKDNVSEQQRLNYEVAAELTKHVRKCEPAGLTISVGGEIGEVGTQNSTPEELEAFMNGYNSALGAGTAGISKISIQTGTSHGGVVLPDGSIAKVALDFGVIDKLGEMARKKFGFGGVVQHGASTLPESAFDNFPKHQAMEVHLATGFQNTIFDSKNFPKNLRDEMYEWLNKNCAEEKKAGMTDEQFYYKARKKVFGAFKAKIWSIPENAKMAILEELFGQFDMLFTKLGISNRPGIAAKYVKVLPVHHKMSEYGVAIAHEAMTPDDNPNAD